MFWVPLICGIVATVFFLVIRVRSGGLPALIVKAVASFFFIATACISLAVITTQLNYGLLIILGLVCGLLGDIWLDLKWMDDKNSDTYLYTGFYSFLIGHAFFITAIYLHYKWNMNTLVGSVAVAAVGASCTIVLEKLMKMNYGKFKITCLIYSFILILTTTSAVAAYIATGETVWFVFSIGGVLFLLSDLVLSGMYFGEGKNTAVNVIINHSLYYGAQFVIASSILFIK